MMLSSWYVALKHDFPKRLPEELEDCADAVRFARWLVLTGRLTDWGSYPLADKENRSRDVAPVRPLGRRGRPVHRHEEETIEAAISSEMGSEPVESAFS